MKQFPYAKHIYILAMHWLLGLSLLCGVAPQAKAQSQAENQIKATQYYYRAMMAQSQEDTAEAVALLTYAHTLAPQDATIAYALGNIYMKERRLHKARPLLAQAYRSDSSNRDFMRDYAITLASIDSGAKATQILEQWLRHDAGDEEVQQYLAKIYFRTSDYQKAIDLYEHLRDANKDLYSEYRRFALLRTRLYLASGERDKALAELRNLVQTFPYEHSAKLSASEMLMEQNMYTEAKGYIDALEREGNIGKQELRRLYIPYYREVGDSTRWEQVLREELGDPQVAGSVKMKDWTTYLQNKSVGDTLPVAYNWVFDQIVAKHPDESETVLDYAKQLELQGLNDKSISLLRSLVKTAPELSEVWTHLMAQLVERKEYDELKALTEEGLKHHPREWRIAFLGMASYFMRSQNEEGRKYLERVLPKLEEAGAEDYGLSILYGTLGDTYEEHNRKRSYEYYDKALELNEDNADVLNNYAYYLALEGKELEKAEHLALRGLKVRKDNANLLDTYAWVLYLRGNYSLANLYIRKAIDSSQDDVSATLLDHYGDILRAEGKVGEAKEQWQKAIELYQAELKAKIEDKASKKEQREIERKIKRLREQIKKMK